MAGTVYHFPILDGATILQHLNSTFPELGFTEEDLKRPKAERMHALYRAFLEHLVNVTPDMMNQVPFENSYELEYPELHEDTIPLYILAVTMQRLMFACGVEDFRIKDIIDPKPKRSIRLMSALINFGLFRNDRVEVYAAIKNENNALVEQRNTLLQEDDNLQRKINAIQVARVEQEPEIKKLEEAVEQLKNKMAELNKVCTTEKKTIDETKKRISEKKSRMAQLKEAIAAAKERNNDLSNKIVQSPERMKNEMDRMGRQLAQQKQTKEEKRGRLMELQKQAEQQQQLEGYSEQGLKIIAAINTENDKEKEELAKIRQIRDQNQEKKDQLRDLEGKEQQLKRQITTKQEKMAKLTLQNQNKIASMSESLKQLKLEKDHSAQQRTEKEEQKYAIDKHCRQLMEEDSRKAQKHEDTMSSLREKYSQLLEQVEVYHTNLGRVWVKERPVQDER